MRTFTDANNKPTYTSIIEKVNPKMSITGFCCRHTIGSGDILSSLSVKHEDRY